MATEGQPSEGTAVAGTAKKTASFISDIRTIIVAAIAVVATVFFAGVYYRDALAKIDEYKNKIDTTERQLAATNAELKALKASLNTAFMKFATEINNSGGVIQNTEPRNNGGGNSPNSGAGRCPLGAFVVGIQPYKYPDDVRQINFQCGSLPKVDIN